MDDSSSGFRVGSPNSGVMSDDKMVSRVESSRSVVSRAEIPRRRPVVNESFGALDLPLDSIDL